MANVVISDLAESTAPASTDLLEMEVSSVSKKVTLGNAIKTGIGLGSDADGDMYYRASSVLARLAKGAANLKLFMNAGATAPEWAAGIYMGSFTRDVATASGTQDVASVGFKPSFVVFLSNIDSTPTMSIGIDNGTFHFCIFNYHTVTTEAFANTTSGSLYAVISSGNNCLGSITTLGADGFTVTWAKTGSPTGSFVTGFIAFR